MCFLERALGLALQSKQRWRRESSPVARFSAPLEVPKGEGGALHTPGPASLSPAGQRCHLLCSFPITSRHDRVHSPCEEIHSWSRGNVIFFFLLSSREDRNHLIQRQSNGSSIGVSRGTALGLAESWEPHLGLAPGEGSSVPNCHIS